MSAVVISGADAVVQFDRFDLESYRLFLRAKQLPEKRLAYDWRTGAYTVRTPARFANLLDPDLVVPERPAVPLADHLFDYQAFVVDRALEAKRYAVWADTGLGKTAILLEFARQVRAKTGGPVLVMSPLGIIEQTRAEAARWYGQDLHLDRIETRDYLAMWCRRADGHIGITNPEKLIPGVLDDLRHCAGLILDESSILKSGGGVIKWNLIKSARGIEYKLSLTATPAPNDVMEYASQAAFLERLRTEGEILWTYFSRNKSGEWSVKPHARKAFYEFMASWSIYLRDPAHYGWADILSSLPPPEIREERLRLTDEQRCELQAFQVESGAGLFSTHRMGVRERSKLSQLAKGFLYEGSRREARRVLSLKPCRVADIVREELAGGRPTIVWTVFDEESEILAELLQDLGDQVAYLHGDTPENERLLIVQDFQRGNRQVLVSKAQLVGYGLNLQRCRSMVFSGFDDSFERAYQAVRRAYRYGQTEPVRVWWPYIPELEGLQFDNVRAKEARFMQEVAAQESAYIEAMRATGAVA